VKTTRLEKGSKLVAAIAVLMATGLTSVSCANEDPTMTPREGRDQVVEFVKATTAQTTAKGWWPRNGVAAPGACSLDKGHEGANYDYYLAAPRGTDHAGKARLVADYWKTLGMNVRIVGPTESPAVLGEGGPVLRAMFETDGPDNLYLMVGVAPCAPGDAVALNNEDEAERKSGKSLPGDEGIVLRKDPRDRPAFQGEATSAP
jgi:hypothetical protein